MRRGADRVRLRRSAPHGMTFRHAPARNSAMRRGLRGHGLTMLERAAWFATRLGTATRTWLIRIWRLTNRLALALRWSVPLSVGLWTVGRGWPCRLSTALVRFERLPCRAAFRTTAWRRSTRGIQPLGGLSLGLSWRVPCGLTGHQSRRFSSKTLLGCLPLRLTLLSRALLVRLAAGLVR